MSGKARSISVTGSLYAKLKKYCDENHLTMTSVVESRLNDVTGENVQPKRKPGPRP